MYEQSGLDPRCAPWSPSLERIYSRGNHQQDFKDAPHGNLPVGYQFSTKQTEWNLIPIPCKAAVALLLPVRAFISSNTFRGVKSHSTDCARLPGKDAKARRTPCFFLLLFFRKSSSPCKRRKTLCRPIPTSPTSHSAPILHTGFLEEIPAKKLSEVGGSKRAQSETPAQVMRS